MKNVNMFSCPDLHPMNDQKMKPGLGAMETVRQTGVFGTSTDIVTSKQTPTVNKIK